MTKNRLADGRTRLQFKRYRQSKKESREASFEGRRKTPAGFQERQPGKIGSSSSLAGQLPLVLEIEGWG